MSIVTKKGDDGTTGLLMGGRVSKTHPRIQAIGAIDELNAHLGICKIAVTTPPAITGNGRTYNELTDIQKQLVQIMGELAVANEQYEKWQHTKLAEKALTAKHLKTLEESIIYYESTNISFNNWATPGSTVSSAQFDLATRVCRRAEREVIAMNEAGHNSRLLIQHFLNRLSDYLWIVARTTE